MASGASVSVIRLPQVTRRRVRRVTAKETKEMVVVARVTERGRVDMGYGETSRL